MGKQDERLWNQDLISLISQQLSDEFPNVKITKEKILKDIFLFSDYSSNEKIQFGFVEQDIVIYEKEIDISELNGLDSIKIHNNTYKSNKLIVPKIICELKYGGVSSHGLMTYSEYSANIKSIFPDCQYWLLVRFKKDSSRNKLVRHGKHFDHILCFDDGFPQKSNYNLGDFQKTLLKDYKLNSRFDEFIQKIKLTLKGEISSFLK